MKKILLSLTTTICFFVIVNTAKAQCDLVVNNFSITQVGTGSESGGNCNTVFNVSFDVTTNSGFKYLYLHSWLLGNYPNPSIFDCSNGHTPNQDPGNVTQLGSSIGEAGKSVLDLGFNNLNDLTFTLNTPVNVLPKLAATPNYPNNDNNSNLTVALNSATSAVVTRTGTNVLHFDIQGIAVSIAGTCGPITVKTDIWGSNSSGAQLGTSKSKIGAQCYICGLSQTFNNPSISLQKNCVAENGTSQVKYSLGLLSSVGSGTLQVVYKVYADEGNIGVKDFGGVDPLLYTSPSFNLLENTQKTFADQTLPYPYCCIAPWANEGIYVDVQVQGFSNSLSSQIVNTECATLPIKLKSFNARRSNRTNVDLTWETEIEENNKGFFVERRIGANIWQDIRFVPSQAKNGNSTTPLTYTLPDFNDAKGISQYRLRQVDIDGKLAYSYIRSVRGEGQKSDVIVYPNPSGDGKINIIFDDAKGARDVSVTDMSGRTIKQMKGVTSNNIRIDNLNAGFYSVRVLNTETGVLVVEKVVVNKR